jgi:hypothetical protein
MTLGSPIGTYGLLSFMGLNAPPNLCGAVRSTVSTSEVNIASPAGSFMSKYSSELLGLIRLRSRRTSLRSTSPG